MIFFCGISKFLRICSSIYFLLFYLASKTVDIQDFLRFFNPDGSAAADNLSPIRRRVRLVLAWVKLFRINPEFKILRLTFHRKSALKC